jgi:hypothetical protein
MTGLAAVPDLGPLLRTLLRLRHDLVMIGRAAAAPLPGSVRATLAPPLARICDAAVNHLRQSRTALRSRRDPPPLHRLEIALNAYLTKIENIRLLELTRDLPIDAIERIFALGFALEQLQKDLTDLARVLRDYALSRRPAAGNGQTAETASILTCHASRTRPAPMPDRAGISDHQKPGA